MFKKKLISLAMTFSMVFSLGIVANAESVDPELAKDTIILYTNDVHCAIDNYGELAAYAKQLEEEGHPVIIVDAGDHLQGEAIGSMTKGKAIVDLMDMAGYDYAVPGNHEFDYKMNEFFNRSNEAQYEYLSANFVNLETGKSVFPAYVIEEVGEEKIAIIGVSTPESYTKSTPAYFQDENGKDIYGFSEDDFYAVIQKAIDEVTVMGADRIVVVGHLGINGTTDGWKSTDVIANTTGIDVFLDAHTHEVIESASYTDRGGNTVILSSTGSKFTYFGKLTLSLDAENAQVETTELIDPQSIVVDESSPVEVQNIYMSVEGEIEEHKAKMDTLNKTVLGSSEVTLTENHPESGKWIMRTSETNLGDFVADAYRTVAGADVALVNSGGIRASVPAGDITRLALMNVNPWNNEMVVVEATGQQILDALEHGARLYPTECGGFLQISGLYYEIHGYIESPVLTDDKGSFKGVDGTKERRVKNVKIGGQPVDPLATYTVTGSLYMLKEGGDGFTMFADSKIIKREVLPVDSEMLIQYFTENLDGLITEAQYGNALGRGNIVTYLNKADVPGDEDKDDDADDKKEDSSATGKGDKTEEGSKTKEVPKTGDATSVNWYVVLIMGSCMGAVLCKKYKKSI